MQKKEFTLIRSYYMGCEAYKVFSFKVDIKQTHRRPGGRSHRIQTEQNRTEHNGKEWNGKERVGYVFVPVPLFILLVNSFTGYGSLLSSSLPMSPTVIGCAVLQPSVNYAHCCCCPHQLFYCRSLFFYYYFALGLYCLSMHVYLPVSVYVSVCVCVRMCMCYRFVLICLVEATHAQNFYHSLQEWS